MKPLRYIAALCTLLIGCTHAEIEELSNTTSENGIPSHLYATLDSDTTRIELNNELNTVWSAGDAVSLFYRTTANNRFTFIGATGDKSGTLERETAYTGTAMEDIVAIYPYSEEYVVDLATNTVEIELPATQHYLTGSYGVGDNPMLYAGDSDNILLRSLCGWIR